ncbi:MAG: DUF2141 domain-containing protein [Alphaproteobacteria bacterium]|nr:DUF2141 domain-containing protein [Rickettsiales bacterium]
MLTFRSNTKLLFIALFAMSYPAFIGNSFAKEVKIAFDVEKKYSNIGELYVSVSLTEDSFNKAIQESNADAPSAIRTVIPASTDVKEVTLQLPDDTKEFAIVAFQDINGNGKLDKGLFGRTKEPVGFSNNPSHTFGPPSYSDSVVTISSADKDNNEPLLLNIKMG